MDFYFVFDSSHLSHWCHYQTSLSSFFHHHLHYHVLKEDTSLKWVDSCSALQKLLRNGKVISSNWMSLVNQPIQGQASYPKTVGQCKMETIFHCVHPAIYLTGVIFVFLLTYLFWFSLWVFYCCFSYSFKKKNYAQNLVNMWSYEGRILIKIYCMKKANK